MPRGSDLNSPGGTQVQRKIVTVIATWAVLAFAAASPSSAVVGGTDAAPGETSETNGTDE